MIKTYELFFKFKDNSKIFRFKRKTIKECKRILNDLIEKYPEGSISYKIVEKTVIEKEGEEEI